MMLRLVLIQSLYKYSLRVIDVVDLAQSILPIIQKLWHRTKKIS
ncbi:hypothetical protein BQ1740_0156 [Bacillus subtilis]|nr:hypothetical protein BQ1740_0156 [Bacillus subtilis]